MAVTIHPSQLRENERAELIKDRESAVRVEIKFARRRKEVSFANYRDFSFKMLHRV